MDGSQVVVVVAVVLGAASIAWGRIARQQLPLMGGMGMIASTCLLVGRSPYPVAALVLAVWVVVVLAGWLRSRRRRPAGPATGAGASSS